ncbi:MAG: tetratricopeptide repeat protein [Elusimicrobiales bacterium]
MTGKLLSAAAVALLAIAAMQPAFRAGYVELDDREYIANNPRVLSLSPGNIARIFSVREQRLYTPLTTLSFALDYRLFGQNLEGYHAENILFHALNSVLVMRLLAALSGSAGMAFAGAALFAVHPMHVESVAWLAERKDMLYGALYLAAFLLYLGWRERGGKWRYGLSLAAFALSLLAKPMAVTLPLALLIADKMRGRAVDEKAVREKIPFFALAGLFVWNVLRHPGGAEAALGGNIAMRICAPLYAMLFYIVKLTVPAGLSPIYNIPQGGMGALALYAAVFCVAAFLVWLWVRDAEAAPLWLLFFAATLLPVMQVVPFGPVITADRYSYIPSLGIFMAWFYAARKLARRLETRLDPRIMRNAGITAAAVIVAVFAVMARERAALWGDAVALWKDSVRKHPSPMGYTALGCSWLERGFPEAAEQFFGVALTLNPNHATAIIALGNARAERGDWANALAAYRSAMYILPENPFAIANVANVHFHMGDLDAAQTEMKKAVSLLPDYPLFRDALSRYGAAARERARQGK